MDPPAPSFGGDPSDDFVVISASPDDDMAAFMRRNEPSGRGRKGVSPAPMIAGRMANEEYNSDFDDDDDDDMPMLMPGNSPPRPQRHHPNRLQQFTASATPQYQEQQEDQEHPIFRPTASRNAVVPVASLPRVGSDDASSKYNNSSTISSIDTRPNLKRDPEDSFSHSVTSIHEMAVSAHPQQSLSHRHMNEHIHSHEDTQLDQQQLSSSFQQMRIPEMEMLPELPQYDVGEDHQQHHNERTHRQQQIMMQQRQQFYEQQQQQQLYGMQQNRTAFTSISQAQGGALPVSSSSAGAAAGAINSDFTTVTAAGGGAPTILSPAPPPLSTSNARDDDRPYPRPGVPRPPNTTAQEPPPVPSKLGRRCLTKKWVRTPDKVMGEVVVDGLTDFLNIGRDALLHLECVECQTLLQVPKTTIIIECPRCENVYPAVQCRLVTEDGAIVGAQ